MSMKQKGGIKLINEAPPWFSLENYRSTAEFSGNEVLEALQRRIFSYEDMALVEPYGTGFALLEDIRAGKPYRSSDEFDDDECDERNECLVGQFLSEATDVIHPLDYVDVADLMRMGNEAGKMSRKDDDFSCFDSVSLDSPYKQSAVVEIALGGNTNEQIIGTIAQLLPKWRQELGIPEPTRVTPKVGESTIRKILDYKLIPWLDLEIWALSEGVKINRNLLAKILFDDDLTKDGNWISDKTKGGLWFSRAVDPNFLAQMKGFLALQPELADRPVGRYRSHNG